MQKFCLILLQVFKVKNHWVENVFPRQIIPRRRVEEIITLRGGQEASSSASSASSSSSSSSSLSWGREEDLSGLVERMRDGSLSSSSVASLTSKVPSSKLSRLFQYGSLAVGLGAGTASAAIASTFSSSKVDDSTAKSSLFLTEANAERLVATLTKMRGAALKLGQMISIQDSEIIPPEISRIFQRVRDRANFMPKSQMEAVMEKELGRDWKSRFLVFHDDPIAAASIGQVHRAVILDDSKEIQVAVKIQYPGVAESIDSDLDTLKSLLLFGNLLPKGLFVENIVTVAKRELAWEVDYEREARYTMKFRDLLKGDSVFRVPAVYPKVSSRRILTTEWMDGFPINLIEDSLPISAESTLAIRNKLASELLRLTLKELFQFQLIQTDPNWSNFLFLPERRQIGLIDFGASREYDYGFVRDYRKLLFASYKDDRESMLDLSIKLGFLTGHETMAMKNAHVEAIGHLALPFKTSGLFDFKSQYITRKVRSLIPTMLRDRLVAPPVESYSLHRKLSGTFLFCAKLEAKISCQGIFLQEFVASESKFATS